MGDPSQVLMPVPFSTSYVPNSYCSITSSFFVCLTCPQEAGERARGAICRFISLLSDRTATQRRQRYATLHELCNASENTGQPTLNINFSRVGLSTLGEDESYKLAVASSAITLTAETDLGVMHGLETLLQLAQPRFSSFSDFDSDARHSIPQQKEKEKENEKEKEKKEEEGKEKEKPPQLVPDSSRPLPSSHYHNLFVFPCVNINDKPRFPWRALMIDSARHFMPMHVIKRNIDGMSAVKLNVLHWHLTDDQGFRVESKVFPLLHQLGSDGFFYTQDEVREIIHYAHARGIRVVPEFDVPAHTGSWLAGHPELGSGPGPYSIVRQYGVFGGVLNPCSENTYAFLDEFFSEMCGIFQDEYFHIGGDEVDGVEWSQSAEIQEYMREKKMKDKHDLQAYFNSRVFEILRRLGKKVIGWEEILHDGIPADAVIQSWMGAKSITDAITRGHRVIRSHGYYLDLVQSTESHYLVDPHPDIQVQPAQTQPQAKKMMTRRQKKEPIGRQACDPLDLVIGGDAPIWSEYVSAESVDSRVWPRMAAIAERLWSPKHVTDACDMYRRLETVSQRLEERGLTHRSYQVGVRARVCVCMYERARVCVRL